MKALDMPEYGTAPSDAPSCCHDAPLWMMRYTPAGASRDGFVNEGFVNEGFVNEGFVNEGFVNCG